MNQKKLLSNNHIPTQNTPILSLISTRIFHYKKRA